MLDREDYLISPFQLWRMEKGNGGLFKDSHPTCCWSFRETTTIFIKESRDSRLLSADINICCYIKLLCDIYETSDEIPCFHHIRCSITKFTNARLSANSLVRNLSVSHILVISCHLRLGLSSGLHCLHSVRLCNEVFNRINCFSTQQYFYCILLLYVNIIITKNNLPIRHVSTCIFHVSNSWL